MQIGSPDNKPFPVQFQNSVLNPYFTESDTAALDIRDIPLPVPHFQDKGIQIWLFTVPETG